MGKRRVARSWVLMVVAALVALSQAPAALGAAVRPIDPPSGAAPIERQVTLRWGLDVSDCAPNKTAITQVQVEIDGRLGPAYLPEPADSGLNAGLFAAAAGDGFRFTLDAVNLKTDGTPSVYRWRAFVDCTGPGIPPDPSAVPIQAVGPWSEFRVTRVSSAPGAGTAPRTVPAPVTTPAPVTKPRPRKRRPATDVSRCEDDRGWGFALKARNYLLPDARPVAGDGPMKIVIAQRNPLTTRVEVDWGQGEATTRHRTSKARSSVQYRFTRPGWHRITVTYQKINPRTGKPAAHCHKRMLTFDVYVEGGDWYVTCDGKSCVEWRRLKADWALTAEERRVLADLRRHNKLASCRYPPVPSDAGVGVRAPVLLSPLGLASSVLGAYCQSVESSGKRDPRFEEGASYPCVSACPPGVYGREEGVGLVSA